MTKNTEKLTADTITDEQIRALREEALDAGDDAQAALCGLALASPSPGGGITRDDIETARAACADAINEARVSEGRAEVYPSVEAEGVGGED